MGSCTVAALLARWLACCHESCGRSKRGYITVISHGDIGCWFLAGLPWRLAVLVPHCGRTETALLPHWNHRVSLVEYEKRERRDARRVVRKGVMPYEGQPQ